MTICTLLEILTHWERRSLRDQGSFVSQITANVNLLSDFLKRTWELSLCNSSTKHRGVFKILSARGRGCEMLGTTHWVPLMKQMLLLCLQLTDCHIKKLWLRINQMLHLKKKESAQFVNSSCYFFSLRRRKRTLSCRTECLEGQGWTGSPFCHQPLAKHVYWIQITWPSTLEANWTK